MTRLGTRLKRTLGRAPTRQLHGERPHPGAPTNVEALSVHTGGSEVQTPLGPCWVVDQQVPLSARHGDLTLGALFGAPWFEVMGLMPTGALRESLGTNAIFLDLETTGLDHGAGTKVFLAGLAWCQGGDLHVRQILLREPSEEPALLYLLQATVGTRSPLITFNGASFDLTLLQTRWAFHRRVLGAAPDLKARPHLDLLHLCRSLYRGCVSNARLITLERERLGFVRVDDVPGHLVPDRWGDFVSTGCPSHITGVLTHNVHDVLSMVVLGARLGQEILQARGGPGRTRFGLNLGRLLLRRRRSAEAYEVLRVWNVRNADAPREQRREGLRLLAVAARRERQIVTQREALELLVALAAQDSRAMIDLAILEEHRARNLSRALAWAEAAHAIEMDGDTAKRLTRLRRRLQRMSNVTPPRITSPKDSARGSRGVRRRPEC